MADLAGKARDRANAGAHVGMEKGDAPSKRRTVRKLDGVSQIIVACLCYTLKT